MKLTIAHQDKYSRGQLILRTLFGAIYIGVPHLFLIAIVGIWSAILSFITFWAVLFTGKFPESMFNFQIGFQNWVLRVEAVLGNLVDGYPTFFPKGTMDSVKPCFAARGMTSSGRRGTRPRARLNTKAPVANLVVVMIVTP